MSFLFGGAAVFLMDDSPPQPAWVNEEDNTIDLTKVPGFMPVGDATGATVGYIAIQNDENGVEPATDALGNYAVTDGAGQIVGYFVQVGDEPNAPYRFEPIE